MNRTRIHRRRDAVLLLAASACVFLVGCSGGDKSSLTGTVTLDGEPLANCTLNFTSLEQGPGGVAQTDDSGKYKAAMSLNNDWMAPGEYLVEARSRADVLASENLSHEVKPGDASLPERYHGPESELRMTLEPGSNTVDFELSSD